QERSELSRGRPLEPRRLASGAGGEARQDRLRQRGGQTLSREGPGAVLRPLSQGQGREAPGSPAVSDRKEPVGQARAEASETRRHPEVVLPPQRQARVPGARGGEA